MIGALERLKANAQGALPDQLQAFGISGGGKGFMALMATHPPLDERIARLRSQGGLAA
jgi:heat shock protein HtpX